MARWVWFVWLGIVVACASSPRDFDDRASAGGGSGGDIAGSGGTRAGSGGSRAGSGGNRGGELGTGGGSQGGTAGTATVDAGGDASVDSNGGTAGTPSSGGAGECSEPDGCAECFTGSRCTETEDAVETCVEGRWTLAEACEDPTPLCVEGACGACQPEQRRCLDESNPEMCNDQGQWEPQETCPAAAAFCHEGECVLCEPGATRCSGAFPETCATDGASWVRGAECTGTTPACIAATASCGRCEDGEAQCVGDVPQVCGSNGQWVDSAPCDVALPQCLGGKCVACDPSEGNGRRCAPDATATPQVCSQQGTWENETTCSQIEATPVCRTETGRCACMENDTRCSSNVPQRCVGGSWVPQPACPVTNPVCLEASGTCGCTNNAAQCADGNTPQRCVNNAWMDQTDCMPPNGVCLPSSGTCGCTNGATQCTSNGTPQRCVTNAWVNQRTSACTGDTPVCLAASATCGCADSPPATQLCENSTTPRRCERNVWTPQRPCQGDNRDCYNGNCVCTQGDRRCNPAGSAARQTCDQRNWTDTPCGGNEPICQGAGVCECDVGATRCQSTNQVAECDANRDWNVRVCPSNEACDGQDCAPSDAVAGHVSCNASTVCGPAEQCCHTATTGAATCFPGNPQQNSCVSSPSIYQLDCDGPNDCPSNNVCCNRAFMGFSTICTAQTDCAGTGTAIVCDRRNPNCPAGLTCTATGFPTIWICK